MPPQSAFYVALEFKLGNHALRASTLKIVLSTNQVSGICALKRFGVCSGLE